MPFSQEERETDARIHSAVPPLLWPPNSPDLNPVDYSVWGMYCKTRCIQNMHDWSWRTQAPHKNWVG